MLAVVVVLVPGLVAVAAPAKPSKMRFVTGVAIEDWRYDAGTDIVAFFGGISSDKPKCLRNREIHLEQITEGIAAGSGATDDEGDWVISFVGSDVDPGEFMATVDRRKYKRRRHGEVKRKVVCRRAVSPIFVPGP